jgi:hypothetical protein
MSLSENVVHLSTAPHNKVSINATNAPNPVRHSGMLLAGIHPHANPA